MLLLLMVTAVMRVAVRVHLLVVCGLSVGDLLNRSVVHRDHQTVEEFWNVGENTFGECSSKNLLKSRVEVEMTEGEPLFAEHDGLDLSIGSGRETRLVHQISHDGCAELFLGFVVANKARLPVCEVSATAKPFSECILNDATDGMIRLCF